MLRILLFSALFSSFGNLSAQHLESLNSDRPGLTMSPFTVGSNMAQIEMGYSFRSTDYGYVIDSPFLEPGSREISKLYHEVAVKARIGILERLDVSIQYAPSYESRMIEVENLAPQSSDDQTDLFRFGVKGLILKQNGLVPGIGAEIFYQLGPFGLESAGFIAAAQSQLNERFSVRANISLAIETEAHGGLNIAYQATKKLSVFAEYSGFFSEPEYYLLDNTSEYFDASNFTSGLTFRATPNLMVDLSGSYFLTPAAPSPNAQFDNYMSYLVNVGISGRLDWRKD